MSKEELYLLLNYYSVANKGSMTEESMLEEIRSLPARSQKVIAYAANALLVKDRQIGELTNMQDICMNVIGSEPEFISRVETLLCKCYEGGP